MAKVSTIYDVRIKYDLDYKKASKGLTVFTKKIRGVTKSIGHMNKKTKASTRDISRLGRAGGRAMKGIDRDARRAAKSLDKVSRNSKKATRNSNGGRGGGGGLGLGRAAGLLGSYIGGRELIKHTIGYNRELDTTKKSLATVIQLMDKDTTSRGQGLQKSGMLMQQLRGDAKNSAGTFKEMTDFAKDIAPPVLAAGASMKQLRELTKGSVVAASAFGIRADVAALDIRQALGKGLNKRDPFGSMLLDSIGMTTDAFNELDKASRMTTLQKAFDQPAIKAAAAEYQTSFEGVFSTFKSSLQEFGGKVGSKVFAGLTSELLKANEWIANNGKELDLMAKGFADSMVSAFNMAKNIFGFIVEHKDLLMALAKAFLVTKGIGMMAGPFASLGGAAGTMAAKLGNVTAGLGAFYIGIKSIADSIDRRQEARIETMTDNPRLKELGMLVGGGEKRKGIYEVGDAIARGQERRAKAVGMKDDISVAISKQFGDTKQQRLAKGRYTAGEKLGAAQNGEEMRKLYMKNGKVNLGFTKKAFGVGDDGIAKYGATGMGGSRGVMSDAHRLAGGAGKFAQLTPGEMAGHMMEANKMAGDGEVRRMATFLTGLERTLAVSSRASTELLRATIAGEMAAGDFHRIEGLGNKIKEGAMTQVNAIHGMLQNLGMAPTKASEADKKDKKNHVKIGKIVMQIESNDPDRFAMGVEGLFSDLAKNGAQASSALREG